MNEQMLIDNGIMLHDWGKIKFFIVSVGCGSVFCQGLGKVSSD